MQANACSIEERYLLGARSALMCAIDHGAEFGDLRGLQRAVRNRMLGFPDADRLGDLVGEHACAGNKCGLHLLLAFRICPHAGDMGA